MLFRFHSYIIRSGVGTLELVGIVMHADLVK